MTFMFARSRVRVQAELGHFVVDALPIDEPPAHAYWGGYRNRNALCLAGEPLAFTIVGQFVHFTVIHGPGAREVFYLQVTTLRDADRVGITTLIDRFCPDRRAYNPHCFIRFANCD